MATDKYLDNDDYAQRMDNDIGLMSELYQIFLEDSRNLIKEIDDAVSNNDSSALRISAHTLKGSSACISAKIIQSLASELEDLATEGNMQKAIALNEKLKESYEGTLFEIQQALEKLSAI